MLKENQHERHEPLLQDIPSGSQIFPNVILAPCDDIAVDVSPPFGSEQTFLFQYHQVLHFLQTEIKHLLMCSVVLSFLLFLWEKKNCLFYFYHLKKKKKCFSWGPNFVPCDFVFLVKNSHWKLNWTKRLHNTGSSLTKPPAAVPGWTQRNSAWIYPFLNPSSLFEGK